MEKPSLRMQVGYTPKLITQDGEAYLLHYYIQKGWEAEKFLSLSFFEKLTYKASMDICWKSSNAFSDSRGGG